MLYKSQYFEETIAIVLVIAPIPPPPHILCAYSSILTYTFSLEKIPMLASSRSSSFSISILRCFIRRVCVVIGILFSSSTSSLNPKTSENYYIYYIFLPKIVYFDEQWTVLRCVHFRLAAHGRRDSSDRFRQFDDFLPPSRLSCFSDILAAHQRDRLRSEWANIKIQ